MKRNLLNNLRLLRIMYAIVLLVYFISQLTFLNTDPDISLATGRGAWTDEGLNTCQVRNLVNHGHFNILDCDNFLKTPLFSIFLFPFFKMFGISMFGARLITLFFCTMLLLIFFIRKKTILIGIIFVLTSMMLLPVHQYSHLCLPEMYSSMLIVLSIILFSFYQFENKYRSLILFYIILTFSVLFKIQFAYILILPLLINIIVYFKNRTIANKNLLIVASITLITLLAGIIIGWYLPFQEAWSQIAKQQSGGFSIDSINTDIISENLKLNFLSTRFLTFTVLFLFSFIAAVNLIWKNDCSKEYTTLLIISLCWFMLETHKLSMTYLPIRYLISTYLSMGFLTCIIICHYLSNAKIIYKSSAIFCLLILLVVNSYYYNMAHSSCSYTLRDMNRYFQKLTCENDVVIGPWAPTFAWETKCFSYPIWTNFMKKRSIIEYYSPDYIVTENNQEDSDYAYQKNSIDLNNLGTLSTQTKVANWNINIYKIRKLNKQLKK